MLFRSKENLELVDPFGLLTHLVLSPNQFRSPEKVVELKSVVEVTGVSEGTIVTTLKELQEEAVSIVMGLAFLVGSSQLFLIVDVQKRHNLVMVYCWTYQGAE